MNKRNILITSAVFVFALISVHIFTTVVDAQTTTPTFHTALTQHFQNYKNDVDYYQLDGAGKKVGSFAGWPKSIEITEWLGPKFEENGGYGTGSYNFFEPLGTYKYESTRANNAFNCGDGKLFIYSYYDAYPNSGNQSIIGDYANDIHPINKSFTKCFDSGDRLTYSNTTDLEYPTWDGGGKFLGKYHLTTTEKDKTFTPESVLVSDTIQSNSSDMVVYHDDQEGGPLSTKYVVWVKRIVKKATVKETHDESINRSITEQHLEWSSEPIPDNQIAGGESAKYILRRNAEVTPKIIAPDADENYYSYDAFVDHVDGPAGLPPQFNNGYPVYTPPAAPPIKNPVTPSSLTASIGAILADNNPNKNPFATQPSLALVQGQSLSLKGSHFSSGTDNYIVFTKPDDNDGAYSAVVKDSDVTGNADGTSITFNVPSYLQDGYYTIRVSTAMSDWSQPILVNVYKSNTPYNPADNASTTASTTVSTSIAPPTVSLTASNDSVAAGFPFSIQWNIKGRVQGQQTCHGISSPNTSMPDMFTNATMSTAKVVTQIFQDTTFTINCYTSNPQNYMGQIPISSGSITVHATHSGGKPAPIDTGETPMPVPTAIPNPIDPSTEQIFRYDLNHLLGAALYSLVGMFGR